MTVTLICPNLRCRTVVQVPDQMRGQVVRCSRCGRTFMVPLKPPAHRPAPPVEEPVTNEAEPTKP